MNHPTQPPHRIDGDLTGEHLFRDPVDIAGSVSAGRVNGSDVTVGGDVTGASVNANGSLTVGGRIAGATGVRCFAGSAIRAGEAGHATLIAGERIEIARTLTHCRVCCGGGVDVAGSVVGGSVSGNSGVRCAVAGDAGGTPTVLAAGIDLHFAASFARYRPDIESDFQLAAQTRQQIAPLLAKLKTLNAQQKESVTVSLCEADQLLQSAEKAKKTLRQTYLHSRERATAVLQVERTLHAGVTVRLHSLQVVIPQTMEGPLRLSAGERDGMPAIVVDFADGTERVLPTVQLNDINAPFELFFKATPPAAGAQAA